MDRVCVPLPFVTLLSFFSLVRPEFDSSPESQIILAGSNTTFPCNATGVPNPTVTWTFRGGALTQQHRTTPNSLTLFLIQNDESYEGNYTCSASNRAGWINKTVGLTVDCECCNSHIMLFSFPCSEEKNIVHVPYTCMFCNKGSASNLLTKFKQDLLCSQVSNRTTGNLDTHTQPSPPPPHSVGISNFMFMKGAQSN